MEKTTQTCRKNNILSELAWIAGACAIVAVLLFTNHHLLTFAVVSGESMYPTMESGNLLLVDRVHKTYSKGNIIFAQVPTMYADREGIVKRVIAVEGETVTIDYDKNEVTVNGEVILEPYINLSESDSMLAETDETTATYIVPNGCLFVMGDNRNHSADSRSWEIGFILKANVIGKVINHR